MSKEVFKRVSVCFEKSADSAEKSYLEDPAFLAGVDAWSPNRVDLPPDIRPDVVKEAPEPDPWAWMLEGQYPYEFGDASVSKGLGPDGDKNFAYDFWHKKRRGWAEPFGGEHDSIMPENGERPITDYVSFNAALPDVPYDTGDVTDYFLKLNNPGRVYNGFSNLMRHNPAFSTNEYKVNPYKGSTRNRNVQEAYTDREKRAVRFDSVDNGLRAYFKTLVGSLKNGATPEQLAANYTRGPGDFVALSRMLADASNPLKPEDINEALHRYSVITDPDIMWDEDARRFVFSHVDPDAVGNAVPDEYLRDALRDFVSKKKGDAQGLADRIRTRFKPGDDGKIRLGYDDRDALLALARLQLENANGPGFTVDDATLCKALDASKESHTLPENEEREMYRRFYDNEAEEKSRGEPDWFDSLLAGVAEEGNKDATQEQKPDVRADGKQAPAKRIPETPEVPDKEPVQESSWINRNGVGVAGASLATLAALLYLTNRKKKKKDETVKTAALSEDGKTFRLSSGETIGSIIREWKEKHPGHDVTVDDVVRANGGIPVTRYLAGKKYKFPTEKDIADNRSHATSDTSEAIDTDGVVKSVSDWLKRRTPAGTLARDILRTQTNRLARSLGLTDEDKSILPGHVVDHLAPDQEQWLRYAIQAKNGGNVVPEGRFGGVRAGSGKYQDDYLTYVHPGFRYSFFPSTDLEGPWYDLASSEVADKLRTASWRDIGVPNQIEYMLGDWGWSTDADGNIIVDDVYDFNTGEGDKEHGSYTGLRQHAGRYASKDTDPDSQKTRFKVNLGKPEEWDRFDVDKFHAFNEPYRKDFPKDFYYTDEPMTKLDDNPLSLNAGLGGAGLTAAILAATYGSGKRSKEKELEDSGIARGSEEFDKAMKKWRRNKLLLSAVETALAGVASSAVPSMLKIPV